MLKRIYFVQDIDYLDRLEDFLISAVAAVLGIRLFLHLSNYPQLGGSGLHIAHMLWGGLLMLLSLLLLLTFLGKPIKRIAAVMGGLGFGAFIDELGKFITSDNNYFFQPTIALIYIVFILLYLSMRTLKKYSHITEEEYLANSLEYLREAIVNDLDEEEKKKALIYLGHVDPANPLGIAVRHLCETIHTISPAKSSPLSRAHMRIKSYYQALIAKPWFTHVVTVFFILQALINIGLATGFIIMGILYFFYPEIFSLFVTELDIFDFLRLGTSIVAGMFTVAGVLEIRHARLHAYEMFKRALLVDIFLLQVFAFYQDQLSAFFGLLFNIIVLVTLNYMMELEKGKSTSGVENVVVKA